MYSYAKGSELWNDATILQDRDENRFEALFLTNQPFSDKNLSNHWMVIIPNPLDTKIDLYREDLHIPDVSMKWEYILSAYVEGCTSTITYGDEARVRRESPNPAIIITSDGSISINEPV